MPAEVILKINKGSLKGKSFELELEPNKPEQTTLFNNIFLSIDNLTVDSDNLKKKS